MVQVFNFLNQNAHLIAGIAMGVIGVSIAVFYYGVYKIGSADERAKLIMYHVFKKMFGVCLLSMIIFLSFVPDRLPAVRDWFITIFSLVFISGAYSVWTAPNR